MTIGKKIPLFLFLFLFSCSRHSKDGTPIIFYKNKLIDLGEVHSNKINKGFITIYNRGSADLKLTGIHPDCVCTKMDVNEKTISPNDSARLNFTLRPSITGYIEQYVIVENNSKNEKNVMFLIEAKAD